MNDRERRRAVEEGLCRMGPAPAVAAISSGSVALDWALGAGGFPRGRVVEIYGPEACGKTTLALTAAAEAQREGGTAAFIDADHAFDAAYARALGADLERLLMSQPACAEEAMEIAVRLAASRAVDLVALDSVAALVPRMELEGGAADDLGGLQHRLIEHALRRLAGAAAKSRCAVLLVNQLRGRAATAAGDPETTAGGYALRMHAAIRVALRPVEAGRDVLRVCARIVKNRLAPLRQAEFEIRYGEGIARASDLAACAARCGIRAEASVLAADCAARKGLERAVRRVLGIGRPD